MKTLRICCLAIALANFAGVALAQYGLYGSPDALPLASSSVSSSPTYDRAAVPVAYAATTYAAQPAQGYANQGYQSYGAQQPAAQPYYNAPVAQSYYAQPRPAANYGGAYSNGVVGQSYPAYTGQPQNAPVQTYAAPGGYRANAGYNAYNATGYGSPYATGYGRPGYRTASNQGQAAPTPAPGRAAQAEQIPTPNENPGGEQDSGLMNQMLAEQQGPTPAPGMGGCYPPNNGYNGGYAGPCAQPCGGQCGPYRGYLNQYEQAACGNGPNPCGYDCGNCAWFASFTAFMMGRNDANHIWTTYQTGNNPNQLMNTEQAKSSWKFGGEIRFGHRYFAACDPCSYWGIEGVFWTMEPYSGFASCSNVSTVSTPLIVSNLQFGGVTASNWFDGAGEHRLWRRDEMYNAEINLLKGRLTNPEETPWDVTWSAGFRFFRFSDDLKFGSLQNGQTWGSSGGANEAYLRDSVANNLWGAQLGCDVGYTVSGSLRFYVAPRFGVFNNHMENNFQAYLGNGTVATTGSSGVAGTYPVQSSADAFAFLSQVDVGAEWTFGKHWSAKVGYRVVAVSNVALADHQIPTYVIDIPEIANIDRNGDLILHGGYAGLTFNF